MKRRVLVFLFVFPVSAAAQLADGLVGPVGSTVGPDGALYVAESIAGRISRVDPHTGEVTPFATDLPARLPGAPFGGVVDVAFRGGTAYAITTLVGPDIGGPDTAGLLKITGPDSYEVVADIGQFNIDYPSESDVFVPSGVLYAMHPYRQGFIVSDGHHNRVFYVTHKGDISVLRDFGNVVPAGLEVFAGTILTAQLGPSPHSPDVGKVVAFRPRWSQEWDVASGAPMLVDIERGRGLSFLAIAQGVWDGVGEGSPAMPDTGSLVRITAWGTFRILIDNVDRPTSLEVIGNDAYVVTLDGEVWKYDGVAGHRHWWWH